MQESEKELRIKWTKDCIQRYLTQEAEARNILDLRILELYGYIEFKDEIEELRRNGTKFRFKGYDIKIKKCTHRFFGNGNQIWSKKTFIYFQRYEETTFFINILEKIKKIIEKKIKLLQEK